MNLTAHNLALKEDKGKGEGRKIEVIIHLYTYCKMEALFLRTIST